MGFIVAEISVPLQVRLQCLLFSTTRPDSLLMFCLFDIYDFHQNALGDVGLYSIWAGVLVSFELTTILVMCHGAQWHAQLAANVARKAKDATAVDPTMNWGFTSPGKVLPPKHGERFERHPST